MTYAVIQFAASSLHFAASLEILCKEAEGHPQAHYLYWGNRTSFPNRMSRDLESISGRIPRSARKLVRNACDNISLSDVMEIDDHFVAHAYSRFYKFLNQDLTREKLQDFNFQGAEIGRVLINELTAITRNKDFQANQHLDLIGKLLVSYLQVYSATQLIIDKLVLQRVSIYNGRFLHERAVWDAARYSKVEVALFETMRDRYLERQQGFHDRLNNQKVMIQHWEKSGLSLEERVQVGSKYFDELRGASNPFRNDAALEIIIPKPYFVFFSSSDDEVAGLWDGNTVNLGSQRDCVTKLQKIFDRQDEFLLVIRIHPNLRNKSTAQQKDWNKVTKTKSSIVIGYDQPTSSYQLMDASIGVVTYGSTLGLEAAFAGIPSLILSECSYDQLMVADLPRNWIDVQDWIKSSQSMSKPNLKKRRVNSCIRGYYLATGGNEFPNSELNEVGWGAWECNSFKGRKLHNNRLSKSYSKAIGDLKLLKSRGLSWDE